MCYTAFGHTCILQIIFGCEGAKQDDEAAIYQDESWHQRQPRFAGGISEYNLR